PATGCTATVSAKSGTKIGSITVNVISAKVAFADTDDWGTGFVGQITITNTGSNTIIGWTLEFDFAGTINPTPDSGIWDGTVVSHVGNHYVITNRSWDATIGAGQSVSFGFVSTWDAAHTAPANFILNGVAVPQI